MANFFDQFDTAPSGPSAPSGNFFDQFDAPAASPGAMQKALEPITSYPATQQQMATEGYAQAAKGLEQMLQGGASAIQKEAGGPPGWFGIPTTGGKGLADIYKGIGNTALGGLTAAASPINAGIRTVVGKPIEENVGIPKEYTEFGAGLALPWLGFTRAPALTKVPEAVTAAENIGVTLPKAIASERPLTNFAGQVSTKMPGGGPLQKAIPEALQETGAAVGRAAEMTGGVADAMSAGQGYKTAIEKVFKPTIKSKVSEAYNAVDKLVDKSVTTPLSSTQNAIADIMARRVASGEESPGKAIQTVLGGATRPGGLTYEGVKDLRTRVGEMLDTGIFPEGMSQAELRRVYSSLSDDLKTAVSNAGGESAKQLFERANRLNVMAEQAKDRVSKVLGADRSGEAISEAIIRMARDSSAGDIATLHTARKAVPQEVWQDIAATAASRLGRARNGEFSPNIFINDYAALSDRGKQLLFKDTGNGMVVPYLDDIKKVSLKFIQAGKLANTSGTAGHNAFYTTAGGVVVGALHGSLVEPLSAIAMITGNNVLARALASPSSAANIARWTRNYDALATNPSNRTLGSFNAASRSLASGFNTQFGTKVLPGDFTRAIQPGPMGAGAQEEQP